MTGPLPHRHTIWLPAPVVHRDGGSDCTVSISSPWQGLYQRFTAETRTTVNDRTVPPMKRNKSLIGDSPRAKVVAIFVILRSDIVSINLARQYMHYARLNLVAIHSSTAGPARAMPSRCRSKWRRLPVLQIWSEARARLVLAGVSWTTCAARRS